MFHIDAEGALHKTSISESFEEWATPPSMGVVGRLISVTRVGDAASQSAQDQRRVEDHEQDGHSQQAVAVLS